LIYACEMWLLRSVGRVDALLGLIYHKVKGSMLQRNVGDYQSTQRNSTGMLHLSWTDMLRAVVKRNCPFLVICFYQYLLLREARPDTWTWSFTQSETRLFLTAPFKSPFNPQQHFSAYINKR
jgi:hypothetical protein